MINLKKQNDFYSNIVKFFISTNFSFENKCYISKLVFSKFMPWICPEEWTINTNLKLHFSFEFFVS